MKNLFSWVTEVDLIFAGVIVSFAVSFTVLAVLLSRGGHTLETKKVLDAIEATRTRLDNVDMRIERDHRAQANWMRRLLARFGFLEAEQLSNDIKRRIQEEKEQDS